MPWEKVEPDKILARIEARLKALGMSATFASRKAGHPDAIRNLRRAVRAGATGRGVSIASIGALAPVLGVTTTWLIEGDPRKIEADEELELVPLDKLTPLSAPDVIEAVGYAIYLLIGDDATEAQTRVLARAIVRTLRLPEGFSPEERRKLIEMAVRLFKSR